MTHTIQSYEAMGVAAIFIEDQVPPKRCGQMAGKSVVSIEFMEKKLRAAVAARKITDFFIAARTDALESYGLDEAPRTAI